MGRTILPEQTQRTIQHQFYQARHDYDQWMRLAASILARQSQGASLVTSLHPEHAHLKHLELIGTRGRQVLMVLVFEGGEVRQQMLALAEPVPQERLSQIATWLNDIAQGQEAEAITELIDQQEDALEKELREMAAEIDDPEISKVYLANATSTHNHLELVEEDYKAMFGMSS